MKMTMMMTDDDDNDIHVDDDDDDDDDDDYADDADDDDDDAPKITEAIPRVTRSNNSVDYRRLAGETSQDSTLPSPTERSH